MTKRRYFGTDGIRGRANSHPMTAEVALRVGLAAGKLFRAGHGETATTVVCVEDAVCGPDGKPHVHWLTVPPHVQSAREGVAWTFGKTEREWDPEVET